MADLYNEEASARAVLINIGYRPALIPQFRFAETFWTAVVLELERGILVDGAPLVLAAAVRDHPGNEAPKALLAEIGGALGPVKVLCLFADPLRGSKLRIDREARLLEEVGGIELQIRHAVRVTDIIRAILHGNPQILHFAGHGRQDGRLVFEDDRGATADVGPKSLAQAIAAASAGVLDCIVLNSCFTGGNAESFRMATRAVTGSARAIEDRCALAFTRGFYTGIGAGQKAEEAYETGRAEMELEGCDTSGLHFISFPPAAR